MLMLAVTRWHWEMVPWPSDGRNPLAHDWWRSFPAFRGTAPQLRAHCRSGGEDTRKRAIELADTDDAVTALVATLARRPSTAEIALAGLST